MFSNEEQNYAKEMLKEQMDMGWVGLTKEVQEAGSAQRLQTAREQETGAEAAQGGHGGHEEDGGAQEKGPAEGSEVYGDGVLRGCSTGVQVEDRHAGQQGLHGQEVLQQGVPPLPGGQGGGGGGDQPPLDVLLRLQGDETWTGPSAGPRRPNNLSKKSSNIEKRVGEE